MTSPREVPSQKFDRSPPGQQASRPVGTVPPLLSPQETVSGTGEDLGLEVLTISGAFPTVPASGVFGYRVDPPSGLYLSFGGGWVPVS